MSQKLQETECSRCGQPITTTRGHITQKWDLTPIPRHHAFWAALLRGPVLAIKQSGQVWRADLDRDHINIPTTRDQTETWLPVHQCWSPPLPGAGPAINLDPPTTTSDFDLFNQPAEDLPPY